MFHVGMVPVNWFEERVRLTVLIVQEGNVPLSRLDEISKKRRFVIDKAGRGPINSLCARLMITVGRFHMGTVPPNRLFDKSRVVRTGSDEESQEGRGPGRRLPESVTEESWGLGVFH